MGSLEIALFISEIRLSFHSSLYNCQTPNAINIKMKE